MKAVATCWALALALMALGCGDRAARNPTTTAAGQKAMVPLPEWAPKDPSAEFLRAAKVLKPLPPEMLDAWAKGQPAMQAAVPRASAAQHPEVM